MYPSFVLLSFIKNIRLPFLINYLNVRSYNKEK